MHARRPAWPTRTTGPRARPPTRTHAGPPARPHYGTPAHPPAYPQHRGPARVNVGLGGFACAVGRAPGCTAVAAGSGQGLTLLGRGWPPQPARRWPGLATPGVARGPLRGSPTAAPKGLASRPGGRLRGASHRVGRSALRPSKRPCQ